MDRLRSYWSNGGKKDIAVYGCFLTILLYLIKVSIAFGEYKNRFTIVEQKINEIAVMQSDIKELKTDVAWIKMYLEKRM